MPTPRHSIFTNQMLSLMPKQQCQSTEGHKTTQHLANVTPLRKTKTKKNIPRTVGQWHRCRWHPASFAPVPLLSPAQQRTLDDSPEPALTHVLRPDHKHATIL